MTAGNTGLTISINTPFGGLNESSTPVLILAILATALSNDWTHVRRDEAWTPRSETISRVQETIESKVRHDAALHQLELPKWSTYGFQYQGRVVDGKQVVFLTAYCWLPEDHPKDEFIFISDGGTCFFETTYDPANGKFSPIVFHGYG